MLRTEDLTDLFHTILTSNSNFLMIILIMIETYQLLFSNKFD